MINHVTTIIISYFHDYPGVSSLSFSTKQQQTSYPISDSIAQQYLYGHKKRFFITNIYSDI